MAPEIPSKLPTEVEQLQALVLALGEMLDSEREEKDALKHRLQQMLRHRFGSRSEKFSPGQKLLNFPGVKEALAAAGLAPSDLTIDAEAIEEDIQEQIEDQSKPNKPTGRKKLPVELPREEVVYDVADEDKSCDKCGEELVRIGEDTTEQLEYVPGYFKVIKSIQIKYGCKIKGCEGTVKRGIKPVTSVWRCLAASGLLAHTIISKYDDHLPLYRQQEIIARLGMNISRSTLCNWIRLVTKLLEPLYDLMKERVLQSNVIQTDDTKVKYQLGKGGREPCIDIEGSGKGEANPKSKSIQKRIASGFCWPYIGDAEHPYVVFDFTENKKSANVVKFLGDYRGYMQADAAPIYNQLYKRLDDNQKPYIIEVACWAHARRKFYEAQDAAHRDLAERALAMIGGLYKIESDIHDMLDDDKKLIRQERSKPLLEKIGAWLEVSGTEVVPSDPLSKAIQYTLENWAALNRYIEEGYLEIDNNAAERAIKNIVIGRKNWMFAGSAAGGKMSAICYTFIESCKRSGANLWEWLTWVIEKAAAAPNKAELVAMCPELLPEAWLESNFNNSK